MNVKKTMENVVEYTTACGLSEARSHPEDHPPRAPELGEGAAGMVLTLLKSNRKSYTGFRLVLKSMTLDDLEGSLCAVFQNTCVFRSSV